MKPWVRNIAGIIFGALIIAGIVSASSAPSAAMPAAAGQAVIAPISNSPASNQAVSQQPQLSNENYYTNTTGNTVHSPAYSANGSVPAGASAQCRDGTYSFSQHRSGTCSHHRGVAQWL